MAATIAKEAGNDKAARQAKRLALLGRESIGRGISLRLGAVFLEPNFTAIEVIHNAEEVGRNKTTEFAIQAGFIKGDGLAWSSGIVVRLMSGRASNGVERLDYGTVDLAPQAAHNRFNLCFERSGVFISSNELSGDYRSLNVSKDAPILVLRATLDLLRSDSIMELRKRHAFDEFSMIGRNLEALDLLAHVVERMGRGRRNAARETSTS